MAKPRLWKAPGGKRAEASIPAYEVMQEDANWLEKLAAVMLGGVSTRNCAELFNEMAKSCGVLLQSELGSLLERIRYSRREKGRSTSQPARRP